MKATTLTVTEGIDLTGKTALVTGSSSGIGRECARVLALRGARVLMANRNEQKTNEVIKSFSDSIGMEAVKRCEFRKCDTASMKTIHVLAKSIKENNETVDYLFLNAGVFGVPFQLTEDGLERTCATNYIGHFLLTHLLTTGHSLSPNGRIIGTAAIGAYHNPFSKMDLEMVAHASENEKRFSRANASPNSKVLLLLFLQEYSRRVAGTSYSNVTTLGADPGGTLTENVNQGGFIISTLLKTFGSLLLNPIEVGVSGLLWCATNPDLAGSKGQVFAYKQKEIHLRPKCTNVNDAKLAWDTTEKVLGLPEFSV